MLALLALLVVGAGALALGKQTTFGERIAGAIFGHRFVSGVYPMRFNLDHTSDAEDTAAQPLPQDGVGDAISPAGTEAELAAEDTSDPTAAKLSIPHSSEQFARAFGDLDTSFDAPSADTAKLLALNFSIENPRAHADSIEIRKAAQADGVKKGKVSLRIVNDTTIMVNSRDVEALFGNSISEKVAASLRASPKVEGYIDFDALRAAGVQIRYDAARDIVVMSSRPS